MKEFFNTIYEWFLGDTNSDAMVLEDGVFFSVGLCMILIPAIMLTLYYYALNSVKLSKWYHWLILVAIICAINFAIACGFSWNEVESSTSITFGLANVLLTVIFSFVFSLIIKWGSSACRRTPF